MVSASRKKEQGASPAQKLCRPYFPERLDFILIDGATLLVRARAPPETWTTRLKPCGRSGERTGRPLLLACHHFQQPLFKIRAGRRNDRHLAAPCSVHPVL